MCAGDDEKRVRVNLGVKVNWDLVHFSQLSRSSDDFFGSVSRNLNIGC